MRLRKHDLPTIAATFKHVLEQLIVVTLVFGVNGQHLLVPQKLEEIQLGASQPPS